VGQPQMRTGTASNSSTAAQLGQLSSARLRRLFDNRGSSPFRLRVVLLVTVVAALAFAVFGAYGVNKRKSSIEAARHAASELISLQTIGVFVVQADSVASQSYLVGGQEDPAQRKNYLTDIDTAGTTLVDVGLHLDLGTTQSKALQSVASALTTYAGYVEQARANNRQGFPVGAAYQRQANAVVTDQIGPGLRTVEDGQRDTVNSNLGAAHRAGVWLVALGALAVAIVLFGAVWLALRFRRIVNVPLGIAVLALLAMVIVGGAVQQHAIDETDGAVGASLTNADLVAQARAAAFDARSQEALTLINRGNGQANEDAWLASDKVVTAALKAACTRDADSCPLTALYGKYDTGHVAIRALDDGGNWDEAVAFSLGTQYTADPSVKTTAATASFTAFDTASAATLDDSATAAQADLGKATDRLGLVRILVFIAGLLVAVLAFVGYDQRLREYR
jgi:hypothetical protein